MAHSAGRLPTVSTFDRRIAAAAHVSAAATLLGFVTLAAYFAVGQPWGTVNDVVAVVLGLSMLPVAAGMHRWLRACEAERSGIVFAIGVLGGLSLVIASIAVILGTYGVVRADLDTLLRVSSVAGGIVGLWLLGVALVGLAHDAFRRRVAWAAFAGGVGYLAVTAGFWLGGARHPLTLVGGVIAVTGYTAWAFFVGIRFRTGTVPLDRTDQ